MVEGLWNWSTPHNDVHFVIWCWFNYRTKTPSTMFIVDIESVCWAVCRVICVYHHLCVYVPEWALSLLSWQRDCVVFLPLVTGHMAGYILVHCTGLCLERPLCQLHLAIESALLFSHGSLHPATQHSSRYVVYCAFRFSGRGKLGSGYWVSSMAKGLGLKR